MKRRQTPVDLNPMRGSVLSFLIKIPIEVYNAMEASWEAEYEKTKHPVPKYLLGLLEVIDNKGDMSDLDIFALAVAMRQMMDVDKVKGWSNFPHDIDFIPDPLHFPKSLN